jgi:hypothetical protein
MSSLEPFDFSNEYREASKRCLGFMLSLLDFLAQYRNPKELRRDYGRF